MSSREKLISKKYKLTKDIMLECLKFAKPLSWYKTGKKINVKNRMQSKYSYTLSFNAGTNLTKGGLDEKGRMIRYMYFKPKYSPGKMLSMGIMGGKYCNDQILEFPSNWYKNINKFSPEFNNPKLNYFGVNSRQSLQEWRRKKWIPLLKTDKDNRGWFEWYCRYWLGRRQPDIDAMQIKRWTSFVRHYKQFLNQTKGRGNKTHPKRRQALLQWSYPCLD